MSEKVGIKGYTTNNGERVVRLADGNRMPTEQGKVTPLSIISRDQYRPGLHSESSGVAVRAEMVGKRRWPFGRATFTVQIGEVAEATRGEGTKGKKKVLQFTPRKTLEVSGWTHGSARRQGRSYLEKEPGLLVQQGVVFEAKPKSSATVVDLKDRRPQPPVRVPAA